MIDHAGALAHKATGFSAKLLRRGDQCRAVLACAHLFWQPEDESTESVTEQVQSAETKLASTACLVQGHFACGMDVTSFLFHTSDFIPAAFSTF